MQLLRTTVHGNWQQITQDLISENTRLWRTIQVITLLSVLAVLLISLAQLSWPWHDFLRMTASLSVFCALAFWYVYRRHNHAGRLTLLTFLLFTAIAAITAVTRPLPAEAANIGSISPWPVGISAIGLALSWIILASSYRAFPSRMRQLGVTPNNWILNLVMGTMVGGGLGIHLLLAADALAGGSYLRAPIWPVMIWTFCSYAGLQALSEELLFRGLSLTVLTEGLHRPFWKAVVGVTFLNLLVYLVLVPYGQYTGIWFAIVVYRTTLSWASSFLRHRQKSVLPGLVANVLFNLFAAVVIT
jgi:hypothetical protein